MHLNPVIKVLYITTPAKLGFQVSSRECFVILLFSGEQGMKILDQSILLLSSRRLKVTETYNVQTQTFFLGFIRSHWWQLVLHFVMYCHVTSDTIRKDLAWCHLRSLWLGQTTSSFEKM